MDFKLDFGNRLQKDNLPVAPWLAYNELLFVLNEMVFLFESR